MPDKVKGLAYVTKDNQDFLVGIKSLTEYILQEGKLVHNGVAWHETRLKRGQKTVFLQVVIQMFEN